MKLFFKSILRPALMTIGSRSHRMLFLAYLSVLLMNNPSFAQWKIVAPNILKPYNNGAGDVLYCKGGILWAGIDDLVYSTDTGRTWNSAGISSSVITDVSFLDRDSGVVFAGLGKLIGVFKTTDRGQSWKMVLPVFGDRIAYGIGNSLLYAESGSSIYRSFDNGQTWALTGINGAIITFTVAQNGTLYTISGTKLNSSVHASSDSGRTWNPTNGTIDNDSWSIDLDSCDQDRLYVANDDWWLKDTTVSMLLVSTNLGMNWQATLSQPIPYLSGTFASGPHTEYAGTIGNGILRSTDHGMTWQNIGGPSTLKDSRTICVVNDNTILALDSNGNIWATYNSGGDSIWESDYSQFFVSPNTLFSSDTLSCDSILRTILVTRSGCSFNDSIASGTIAGTGAADYRVQNISYDSVSVLMYATHDGNQNAKLVIALENGLTDTVSLEGHVDISRRPSISCYLKASTTTASPGNLIQVPVYFSTNVPMGASSIELPFTLDTNILEPISFQPAVKGLTVGALSYEGSFETVPLQCMTIPLNSNGLLGTLRCMVYLTDTLSTSVSLGTVGINVENAPCLTVSQSTNSVSIHVIGCGTQTLEQFIKDGKIDLGIRSISPNPASSSVQVDFINPASEPISYQISDALGLVRAQGEVSGEAFTLDVHSLASGLYYLRAIEPATGKVIVGRFLVER